MHEVRSSSHAYVARTGAARTYKPLRQRSSSHSAAYKKFLTMRQIGETAMEMSPAENIPARYRLQLSQAQLHTPTSPESEPEADCVGGQDANDLEPEDERMIDRTSLCLPDFDSDTIVHEDDPGFRAVLGRYFPTSESNATEKLVELKVKLKSASNHDFWEILMEGMCEITGSQCGFVAKRMLVDDQDNSIEMPEIGEPGSCLMAVAFYLNGAGVKKLYRDYRYHAYGTPCAYMKHDKVFIVPERMAEFVTNNPNQLPWKQSEAFIGVPLFSDGKCFAHFGMVWSLEGARQRRLSWSYIEIFMHSLEDLIMQRIVEDRGLVREAKPDHSARSGVALSAVTVSQPFRPYARNLSHELRTPLQGVVGMLDIMYNTILDAISTQQNERAHSVFENLKNHIEVVQDSSRRAVEAADNVVHAYDLNLQMPGTPMTPVKLEPSKSSVPTPPHWVDELSRCRKRERAGDLDTSSPPRKRVNISDSDNVQQQTYSPASDILERETSSDSTPSLMSSPSIPTNHHIITRDFMRCLVQASVQNFHPINETHILTALGETIEIETLGTRGEIQHRTIYLEIESDVPDTILTEEEHLQFALQKLVDNAIKFTEYGSIKISVKVAVGREVVEIWIADTGCGIAEDSRSHLFTPHFQEDASITRCRDGLGLSLFNAKAHIRKKLGGDVTLERSETYGPRKGSEFLMRLPILTPQTCSTDTHLVDTPSHNSDNNNFRPLTLPEPSLQPLSFFNTPKHFTYKPVPINKHLAQQYPLNILIAEDNPTNRDIAVRSLQRLGYSIDNITTAFDGVEAVRYFKESLCRPLHQRYIAVFMDIWMPNMDGYEATRQILDIAENAGLDVKVFTVTADLTEGSLDRAKEVGMRDILRKPYKVRDIQSLIVENFDGCASF